MDRLIHAAALFESRWMEIAGAHWGGLESPFAREGEQGPGLEAFGVTGPRVCASKGRGPEKLGALDLGGFVDQKAQCLTRILQIVLKKPQRGRFQRVGLQSHRQGGAYSVLHFMASILPDHLSGCRAEPNL